MNRAIITGRVIKDPDLRYTQGENASAVCKFTVAVTRKYKNAYGDYDSDFISCLAFGKSGELIAKYFPKGTGIEISGHIQTGNYINKDGVKVYTTEIIVDEWDFGKNSKVSSGNKETTNTVTPKNTMNKTEDTSFITEDGSDDDLPF